MCESPPTSFAPIVVEALLDERHVPVVKLEIAIGDIAGRTDAAIGAKQLLQLIRAIRTS